MKVGNLLEGGLEDYPVALFRTWDLGLLLNAVGFKGDPDDPKA